MNSTFIVTFVGTATPLTIKNLAAITTENDGKWLISKVNFIENQVAAVIKVQLPKQHEEVVKEAFRSQEGLLVQMVDSNSKGHEPDQITQLRLDANDRSGIVNEITQVLDKQGVNILDMDCHRVFIADGGGISSSLFTANMALMLPSNVDISDISNELESLSEDTRVIVER